MIAEAAENEEQIKLAAKSMFARMVGTGRDRKIPKSKIDEYVKTLVASEGESGRVGSAREGQKTAETGPRRMIHTGSDERMETLTSERAGVEDVREQQQETAESKPPATAMSEPPATAVSVMARRRKAASEPQTGSSARSVDERLQEKATEGQQRSVKRLLHSALKLSASDEVSTYFYHQ